MQFARDHKLRAFHQPRGQAHLDHRRCLNAEVHRRIHATRRRRNLAVRRFPRLHIRSEQRAFEREQVGVQDSIRRVRRDTGQSALEQLLELNGEAPPLGRIPRCAPAREQRAGRNFLRALRRSRLTEKVPHVLVPVTVGMRIARENVRRNVLREAPLFFAIMEHEFDGGEVGIVIAVARTDHHRDHVARLDVGGFTPAQVARFRAFIDTGRQHFTGGAPTQF